VDVTGLPHPAKAGLAMTTYNLCFGKIASGIRGYNPLCVLRDLCVNPKYSNSSAVILYLVIQIIIITLDITIIKLYNITITEA
jgi:hypothetical protein